jgi:hypothetical protein
VRAQNPVHRIGQVFGLQICELALLRPHLHVKQVVVDLRDQSLQWNAALHSSRRLQRRLNIARIDECLGRRWRSNRRFFEKPRWMSRRRHLFHPLSEDSATPHNVCDLGLIPIDLDRARPQKVRCCMQIQKIRFHVFSSIELLLPSAPLIAHFAMSGFYPLKEKGAI